MALNNLLKVDMPLNKETKPNQTKPNFPPRIMNTFFISQLSFIVIFNRVKKTIDKRIHFFIAVTQQAINWMTKIVDYTLKVSDLRT